MHKSVQKLGTMVAGGLAVLGCEQLASPPPLQEEDTDPFRLRELKERNTANPVNYRAADGTEFTCALSWPQAALRFDTSCTCRKKVRNLLRQRTVLFRERRKRPKR